MRTFILLILALLAAGPAAAQQKAVAPASPQLQSHCNHWHNDCKVGCERNKGSFASGAECFRVECGRRLSACLTDKNGCYFFRNPGPQCLKT